MLSDLTSEQRELAEFMSELSEEATEAVWIHGLEFVLWDSMNGSLDEYGRLRITKEHRQRLRNLSERVGGWIMFGEKGETFVSLDQWRQIHETKE
jgi:hypothetical protein